MRTWPLRACAAVALLLGSGPPATASAATVALRIETDGSDATRTCPPETELRDRIRARLGYDPFMEDSPKLEARVAFAMEQTILAVDVEVYASGELLGRQRIVSRSVNCDQLTTAVALAMSLVIEQFDTAHPERTEQARPPVGDARREGHPGKPRAPSTQQPRGHRREEDRLDSVAWASSAGAAVALGAAPLVDSALDLRVIARRAWWSLALEGRLFAPTTITMAAGTVRTDLATLSAAFCAHREIAVLCAFGGVGELRGTGTSAGGTREGISLRLALGLRTGIEWRLGSVFGIQPYLEGALSPTQTTLYLGRDPVWTSPVVQGALGVDWITHFDGGSGGSARH